ncbi:MAG: OprD family outer membrane porin [Verrucomicrobiales bacterium]|nr:OprD family outer membrane porin [Verrucomicrobiales bacterium]
MIRRRSAPLSAFAMLVLAGVFVPAARSQSPAPDPVASSIEQGQTHLDESFGLRGRHRHLDVHVDPDSQTHFKFDFRTFYFDREKYDDSVSKAFAAGGWVGAKTPFFLDRFSFGVTGYTSQKIHGDSDEDGTVLLEPVQAGYSVLGEAFVDVRLVEGLHLFAGRKEFDTPFLNPHDNRLTPNTFEAVVIQGQTDLGPDGATLKYGAGYFDRIKNRNADQFISMAIDAGATVERGVVTGGALYQKDDFSLGAIDYHSADILNIFYAQSKWELPVILPIADHAAPSLAVQFIDQRSTGDELLTGGAFAVQQIGVKGDLPVGDALFTAGYTLASGGADLRSPWSGYPGYTSTQVEDFNRAGEGALLLRAGYEIPWIEGLSTYALFVNGSDPDDPTEYRKDELDLNLQWEPVGEWLSGLSVRLRYALVEEHGPVTRGLRDFRVICNYGLEY